MFKMKGVITLGESTTRYCGQKWSIQLTQTQADAAERARRLTGFNRQELLSRALDEFIANHADEWLTAFKAKFDADAEPAKTTAKK